MTAQLFRPREPKEVTEYRAFLIRTLKKMAPDHKQAESIRKKALDTIIAYQIKLSTLVLIENPSQKIREEKVEYEKAISLAKEIVLRMTKSLENPYVRAAYQWLAENPAPRTALNSIEEENQSFAPAAA